MVDDRRHPGAPLPRAGTWELEADVPPLASSRARIERIVDWSDTDAAGHHHHASILRWAESAEAALHEDLGTTSLFGRIPRVHYEVDYRARLWFRDRIEITLWVDRVGTTSLRYRFVVHRADDLAATGSMTVVHMDSESGRSTPWSQPAREALMAGARSA